MFLFGFRFLWLIQHQHAVVIVFVQVLITFFPQLFQLFVCFEEESVSFFSCSVFVLGRLISVVISRVNIYYHHIIHLQLVHKLSNVTKRLLKKTQLNRTALNYNNKIRKVAKLYKYKIITMIYLMNILVITKAFIIFVVNTLH